MADNNPIDKSARADRGQSRPAVIIAALLYLITAYQRTPCPCVALCIVRHLECLTGHERVDPVLRQICGAIRETWARVAGDSRLAPDRTANHALLH